MSYLSTRRSFLGALAAGSLALGLTSCTATTGGGSPSAIRFYQSKPETIPYFRALLQDFSEAHPGLRPEHDSNSSLSGSFARNRPPDLGCLNYNFEMARFQERGALSDLSAFSEQANISDGVAELIDQYPTYPGRLSALPYSLMAAGVLYNMDIFEEHSLQVPQTFSGFIELCDTLAELGIQPIYSTYRDSWTITQGLIDYSLGGALDISDFFDRLYALGEDGGPEADTSFSADFYHPLRQALQISAYSQPNAGARGYGEGNAAFARGEAAMYFQGPWALTDIDTLNPALKVGVFPLPMTENTQDLALRSHIDLALWIPEESANPEGAAQLLSYLISPEVADAYNETHLAFGVRSDSPPATDPRLLQMQPFIDSGRFYPGISVSIPAGIPFENYCQAIVGGGDLEQILRTLNEDWVRLARRQ